MKAIKNQPKWVDHILDVFLENIEWTSLKTPTDQTFTYKAQNIDGIWELVISPWMHEIYGGKDDGALRLPTYEVNVLALVNELDAVTYIGFDSDRLEATVEGKICGTRVVIILRRLAPKSRVRKKINTFTGEVTKIITNV
jgi:hypothetical protein